MIGNGLCAFFIHKNVIEYNQYPVITNVNKVYHTAPEFPVVSFCSSKDYNCYFDNQDCENLIWQDDCIAFNLNQNIKHHPIEIERSKQAGLNF